MYVYTYGYSVNRYPNYDYALVLTAWLECVDITGELNVICLSDDYCIEYLGYATDGGLVFNGDEYGGYYLGC